MRLTISRIEPARNNLLENTVKNRLKKTNQNYKNKGYNHQQKSNLKGKINSYNNLIYFNRINKF